MKLFRRMSALLMALMLMLSMSLTVLAAEYDNMNDGFAHEANEGNNYDTDVNINLTTPDGGTFTAKEGYTYNITVDEGGSLDGAEFNGAGTVNIGSEENEVEVGFIGAFEDVAVNVYGDVCGIDGDPNGVDYDDPTDYSDGSPGVFAADNATVSVTGDVSGGDSYGTYGYGGDGVTAYDTATVTVGGNVTGGSVTADPNTEVYTDENFVNYSSRGGAAIVMANSASVSVGGNAIAGSTNGDAGDAGVGVYIEPWSEEGGSLTVGDAVTGGSAENGTDGVDIYVYAEDIEDSDAPLPDMTVGSYDSIGGTFYSNTGEIRDMTDEELAVVQESIKVIEKVEPETVQVGYDSHYGYLYQMIKMAKAGDEITTDIGARKSIPAFIIDVAREAEITLIIKWTGGDDLIITKDFTGEVSGDILLTDLAAMLKK